MTPENYIKLAQAVAWPCVALIGVIILGPGGLLKQLFEMLTNSVLGLNRAVADFKETTASMKVDMNRFAELSEAMSASFTRRIDEIRAGVSNTGLQLDELLSKAERLGNSTSAILGEIVAREVSTTSPISEPPELAPELAAETPFINPPLSADGRYDAIRDEWNKLVELLRSALNRDDIFDARQIGRMASYMVDARRKRQLTEPQAEAISHLHSRIKSFARLYQTREEWLTEDVFRDFVQQLRSAERPLLS